MRVSSTGSGRKRSDSDSSIRMLSIFTSLHWNIVSGMRVTVGVPRNFVLYRTKFLGTPTVTLIPLTIFQCSEVKMLNILILLSLSLRFLPLPVLDTRIKACQHHLSLSNITTASRLALYKQLRHDMHSRYCILEDIPRAGDEESS